MAAAMGAVAALFSGVPGLAIGGSGTGSGNGSGSGNRLRHSDIRLWSLLHPRVVGKQLWTLARAHIGNRLVPSSNPQPAGSTGCVPPAPPVRDRSRAIRAPSD